MCNINNINKKYYHQKISVFIDCFCKLRPITPLCGSLIEMLTGLFLLKTKHCF